MAYVNAEVSLDEFSDQDLIEELNKRCIVQNEKLIFEIYTLRRLGYDYQKPLDKLIYNTLGKIL